MRDLLQLDSFRTDTRTKKIFVLMNTRFIPRKYKNKEGEHLMYLSITSKGQQKRIPLGFTVKENEFNLKTQKVIGKEKRQKDLQLMLDNIEAKITNIKTFYWLAGKVLTIDKLIEEINNNVPRGEFTSFFEYELRKDKATLKEGTYKRHQSILNNLKAYKKEIYFTDIDENFIEDYKRYFLKTQRKLNTYYSNLKIIKKYLRRAVKSGIRLIIDLDDIKVKNIRSNRVALNPDELRLLYNYYFSEFILPGQKITLGTFLFSCYTGLRISDLQKITREQVFSGLLEFVPVKTEIDKPYIHRVRINEKAKSIVEQVPELFVKKQAEQNLNEVIKEIAKQRKIKKDISLHVARHTFATNYLRAGGKVEQLQKLLNHSSLKETMVYVHMVEAEEDDSIFLLDNLF